MTNLRDFVAESNRIEGILRPPTDKEISTLNSFVELHEVTIDHLIGFVSVYQPDARLRDNISVPGVRVGSHIAPPSGPEIRDELQYIINCANSDWNNKVGAPSNSVKPISPFEVHSRYLTLHPFTDGNGRSSRALWLWQMGGRAPLGFLHQFYYQTLDAHDSRR